MKSSMVRLTVPVIGVAVMSGGLLAAAAGPASAAEVVSQKDVAKYHMTHKQVKDVKKAHKLANTKQAKQIRWRESNNHYKARSGQYSGAWQFDGQTWRSNGGKKFSNEAHQAPKWAQDYIMWRTHNARGWQPWGS